MNDLIAWLGGGDLRSDGLSAEVVRFVSEHPELLPDLLEGLHVEDEVIRGRAADAIEHLAREIPAEIASHQSRLAQALSQDSVAMVRWHLAMALGHLALDWDEPGQAWSLLLARLSDRSVFVVSWAIVSLCIYSRLYPAFQKDTLSEIVKLAGSSSAAIRSRATHAIVILKDDSHPFPKGWLKSRRIMRALDGPL